MRTRSSSVSVRPARAISRRRASRSPSSPPSRPPPPVAARLPRREPASEGLRLDRGKSGGAFGLPLHPHRLQGPPHGVAQPVPDDLKVPPRVLPVEPAERDDRRLHHRQAL